MNRICRWTFAAAVFFLALGAAAQEGLYGPPAAENSVWVRVLHSVPGQDELEVDIGAARFGPLDYGEVSPYRSVVRDFYIIRAAGLEGVLEPGSAEYYTVILEAEEIRILEDPAHRDPARAQLFLYNLSSLPELDLRAADGQVEILRDVPPGGSAQIAVNPAEAELGVYSGDALLEEVGDLGLQRGESYSVFVLEGEQGRQVFSAQASVLPR